ncbi:MAG: hypothetical protein DMG05_08440 [Acidobacteria bacterium]|nr:MAG: hypothetical protein DMG05_08440 [Acidobacteriota bacterium]
MSLLERGGLQGGRWESAPSLDSTVVTPSSPASEKGDDLKTNEFLQGLMNFFTPTGRAAGLKYPNYAPLRRSPSPMKAYQAFILFPRWGRGESKL